MSQSSLPTFEKRELAGIVAIETFGLTALVAVAAGGTLVPISRDRARDLMTQVEEMEECSQRSVLAGIPEGFSTVKVITPEGFQEIEKQN